MQTGERTMRAVRSRTPEGPKGLTLERIDVPDLAERVRVGDAVFALTPFDRDGVAAEFAAVPAAVLAPKPDAVDHVQAAAVPMASLTAWQGLFVHGRLESGQRVIVLGAAGGVGHQAVQLAVQRAAYVIGTTSSPACADMVRSMARPRSSRARRSSNEASIRLTSSLTRWAARCSRSPRSCCVKVAGS